MASVSYGSSPPPSAVTTTGTKAAFVMTGAVVGIVETTIVVPIGAKEFRIKTGAGSNAALTISHALGGTAAALTSWHLHMGNTWHETQLSGSVAFTIYIKSNKALTDVQLMYWT